MERIGNFLSDDFEKLKKAGIMDETPALKQNMKSVADHCAMCLKNGGKGFYQNWKVMPGYDDGPVLMTYVCDPEKKAGCTKIKEEHDRIVNRIVESSGLPEVLLTKTMDGYDSRRNPESWKLKERAELFLEMDRQGIKKWLLLCGTSGMGKTHLCSAVSRELMERGKRVKYYPWVSLVQKAKFGDKKDFEDAKHAEILFLDDMYKSVPSESEKALTFELIDYRVTHGLRTLITSEKTGPELAATDTAIARRIIENCGECWAHVQKKPKETGPVQERISFANAYKA